MQMCNTIDNSLNQATTSNSVVTANTITASQLNNSSTSLFSINEDSNGGRDTTRKSTRDPLSHRIIEKKRRDRMNKCLTDLSKLIPQQYIKKGRGRIEKTEIVEMAIKYIKNLQTNHLDVTDYENIFYGSLNEKPKTNKINLQSSCLFNKIECNNFYKEDTNDTVDLNLQKTLNRNDQNQFLDKFRLGYLECLNEISKFNFSNFTNENINLELNNHLMNHLKMITKTFSCDKELILKRKFENKNTLEGLQIKLEEMDVEEQSNENKNLKNYKSETNTLKNYLIKNQISLNKPNVDQPISNEVINNFDNNLKSRSLTSSPISTTDSSFKFKKYINYRFESDLLKNKDGYLESGNTCTRPRSATIDSNLSSLRNNIAFKNKEKLVNSSKELNEICLEKKTCRINSNDFLINSKINFDQNQPFFISDLYPNLNQNTKNFPMKSFAQNQTFETSDSTLTLNNKPHLTNVALTKKIQPGFVLHPNKLYYVPIQIDLSAIMSYFKPNSFIKKEENNNFLCQVQENDFSLINNNANICNNNQSSNGHTLLSSISSISSLHTTFNSQFSTVNLINNLNHNSSKSNYLNQDKLNSDNITKPHPISIDVNFAFSTLPLCVNAMNSICRV